MNLLLRVLQIVTIKFRRQLPLLWQHIVCSCRSQVNPADIADGIELMEGGRRARSRSAGRGREAKRGIVLPVI